MQTSNTAHFILHDYCTATDKGPVCRTFRSETAKRRQKLAGMYCVYAQKGASEAPRTHFKACKIAKFHGSVPPDPASHNL